MDGLVPLHDVVHDGARVGGLDEGRVGDTTTSGRAPTPRVGSHLATYAVGEKGGPGERLAPWTIPELRRLLILLLPLAQGSVAFELAWIAWRRRHRERARRCRYRRLGVRYRTRGKTREGRPP